MNSHSIKTLPSAAAFAFTSLICSNAYAVSVTDTPIDYKFSPVQDTSGAWWNSYTIQSAPGVGYHIEKSSDLVTWTDVATYYGTGGEIVHPLFPGQAPTTAPPANAPSIPTQSASLIQANVTLQKSTSGKAIISWISFDTGLPVRDELAYTLGDVWSEFEGSYIAPHGNYWMAITPITTPQVTSPATATLGTLDSAFASQFQTALPAIETEITQSVSAAQIAPAPTQNAEDATFYRIRADWTLDSDHDGLFDWQELLIYRTDPFNPDTDGDGIPDNQQVGGASMGGLVPTVPESIPRAPVAVIQSLYVEANKQTYQIPNGTPQISAGMNDSDGHFYGKNDPESALAVSANTTADLAAAAKSAASGLNWNNHLTSHRIFSLSDPGFSSSASRVEFQDFYSKYRLHLQDGAAPVDGYHIPVTFALLYQTYDVTTHQWQNSTAPSGKPTTLTLTLDIPEGGTDSNPVEFPDLNVDSNTSIQCIPVNIAIFNGDLSEAPDGLCVKIGTTFALDLNGKESNEADSDINGDWVSWERRALKADGTYDDWEFFTNDGAVQTGVEPLVHTNDFGCFQVRAKIAPPNGDEIYIPAVRMKDATAIKNSHGNRTDFLRAGQPEFFGIVNTSEALKVRNMAMSFLGTEQYNEGTFVRIDVDSDVNSNTAGANKYNIFVAHMAKFSGYGVPFWYRYYTIPYAPIAADDWCNQAPHVDLESAGWHDVGTITNPMPGMVIASPPVNPKDNSDHGHCGILDYDGSWISAGALTVNKSIHPSDTAPENQHYKPYRMHTRPFSNP